MKVPRGSIILSQFNAPLLGTGAGHARSASAVNTVRPSLSLTMDHSKMGVIAEDDLEQEESK